MGKTKDKKKDDKTEEPESGVPKWPSSGYEERGPAPLDWRRLVSKYIARADYVSLSWATSNNGTFFPIGDDRKVRVVDVTDKKTGRVHKTIEHEHGTGSPELVCDQWWSEAFEVYEQKKSQRGGKPTQVIAQLELFDKHGELLDKSAKVVTGISDVDSEQQWVADAETEEEKRDRGLLQEMRRERKQLFELAHGSLQAASAAIERMASSVDKMQNDREQRLVNIRDETAELAEMAGTSDGGTEQLKLLMEIFKDVKQSHVAQPNAEGVDKLVAECREISSKVSDEQWAKLVAVNEHFALLRGAIMGSEKYNATRATVREQLMQALGVLQNISVDPGDVRAAIGADVAERIQGLSQFM